MAKKAVEGVVTELKKLLADGKLVLGGERVLKLLRERKLSKVFVSSDCSVDVRARLEHYCGVYGVLFELLSKSSEDIGVICRKPFPISVVGVL